MNKKTKTGNQATGAPTTYDMEGDEIMSKQAQQPDVASTRDGLVEKLLEEVDWDSPCEGEAREYAESVIDAAIAIGRQQGAAPPLSWSPEIHEKNQDVERFHFRCSAIDAAGTIGRGAAAPPVAGSPGIAELESVLARVETWTLTHGAALKPPRVDTYGEGMRDAKEQVRRLLDAAPFVVWSTEWPTESGWYWTRRPSHDDDHVATELSDSLGHRFACRAGVLLSRRAELLWGPRILEPERQVVP